MTIILRMSEGAYIRAALWGLPLVLLLEIDRTITPARNGWKADRGAA